MEAAERVSRERGAASARLEVSTVNAAAIALYRGLGYRTEGVLPGYYSWGEDAFAMRKRLDTNS
jgi:ribosomal-protein-alanine N-acetyltransferase